MTKIFPKLLITLSLEGGDLVELVDLTRELSAEIESLNIESVENISAGLAPGGTKSADWASIGQMAVTLAPTVTPPLFNLLKSWVERKPSTPVKIKIKVGRKTAQIEYDPTETTPEELEALIKTLGKPIKK